MTFMTPIIPIILTPPAHVTIYAVASTNLIGITESYFNIFGSMSTGRR